MAKVATKQTAPETSLSELEKQKVYAEKLEKSGFGFDLVIGDAFVRGMRDIGYKNTGTAIDELIDNAIEAGATRVVVGFKPDKNGKKPEALCVADDGHGMVETMLRAAVMWGGTHRENSRKGIGRYGYGLPSASVSQCKRFTVYSRTKDNDWHSVTVDMDAITAGEYTDKNGHIVTPPAEKNALPSWIEKSYGKQLKRGTVVVWEKLDRLTWNTLLGLTGNLVEHFGITYRNYLRGTEIIVGDKTVEPVDPVFSTADFRYYDTDGLKANVMPPIRLEVKTPDGEKKVPIKIRSALFPYGFAAKDLSKRATEGNLSPRGKILRENNGLIVCRMGRQIDVVTRTPPSWPSITTNNDRLWAIEIDFPAELDEEFSITTSKQRIEISDRIWEILEQAGLIRTISSFKEAIEKDQKARRAQRDAQEDEARPSEKIMLESEKFIHVIPGQSSEEREKLSREAFEKEVKKKQQSEKKSPEQARKELEEEVRNKPYKIQYEDIPEGTFYRVEQIGPQLVVFINRRHAFFSSLYSSKDSNPRIRAALELMLFVLGKAEMDAATGDRKHFYRSERQAWSTSLDVVLDQLNESSGFDNEEDLENDQPSRAKA